MAGLSDAVLRSAALQRRMDRREMMRVPALLRSGSHTCTAVLVDLSPGGAGLDGVPPSIAGRLQGLEFSLEGRQMSLPLATVWSAPSGELRGQCQVGARFPERAMDVDRWLTERRLRTIMDDCLQAEA